MALHPLVSDWSPDSQRVSFYCLHRNNDLCRFAPDAPSCLVSLSPSPGSDFFFFNVSLFLREKQSVIRGGAEREGDAASEAGSRL